MLNIKTHEIATSTHEIGKFSKNERVEIAISCVLVSTLSDLSVFVSHLCPAKEPEKNMYSFFRRNNRMCRVCFHAKDQPKKVLLGLPEEHFFVIGKV